MFKKFFLIIIMTFSLKGMVGDDGVIIPPGQHFDYVELCLEGLDYISESLNIFTLGNKSENKLRIVCSIARFNSILNCTKEVIKLDFVEGFQSFGEDHFSYGQGESVIMHLLYHILRESFRNDKIDSLAIWKMFSHLGYSIVSTHKLKDIKNSMATIKKIALCELNYKKLEQFSWLSLNKFLPIMITNLIGIINYRDSFGTHHLVRCVPSNKKTKSSLYIYLSLVAGISELIRRYRQAQLIKLYDFGSKTILKTS